jgi:hypothetical protein
MSIKFDLNRMDRRGAHSRVVRGRPLFEFVGLAFEIFGVGDALLPFDGAAGERGEGAVPRRQSSHLLGVFHGDPKVLRAIDPTAMDSAFNRAAIDLDQTVEAPWPGPAGSARMPANGCAVNRGTKV